MTGWIVSFLIVLWISSLGFIGQLVARTVITIIGICGLVVMFKIGFLMPFLSTLGEGFRLFIVFLITLVELIFK